MITTYRHGATLFIVSDNPPVNALGSATRQGLADAISDAGKDETVQSIVIRCKGRTFFAGADISEFGKPMCGPTLPEICDAIEACQKPVIAAIHGSALGGGLEVALAAHYRIAVPSATLGLPEVKLGLIPGAGGTQRLPRVVGVPLALTMATGGAPISAAEAKSAGLVDRLAGEERLEDDAILYALEVAGERRLPRSSDRHVGAAESLFAEFRVAHAHKFRGLEAPDAIIRAIEASVTRPFVEGQAIERQLFIERLNSPQSAALRHLFFAERRASKIEDIPVDTQPLPIRQVGIVGAGTMGTGIAMNFLSAGFPVTIVDASREALDRGVAVIRKNYGARAEKGRIKAIDVEAAMALLTPSVEFSALAQSDLVIEAAFELMEVKKDIFKRLDALVRPNAVLASNTSYLDLNEIAAVTRRPEAVIGLHFFSPAHVMKLLEIVRGSRTSAQVLTTAMALSRKIKKIAVVAGVCFGFIGNRMLRARQTEAGRLLLEGATPAQVDRVVVEFGLPMGPFQMADLAGVDIGWHRDAARRDTLQEILCAKGRLGQKARRGYYDYDDTRRPISSDFVTRLIRDLAAVKGIVSRDIEDEEILVRCLYVMVNEGAKILEEAKAQRASDIDVVWVNGYGWPAWRGGPMYWADTVGLDTIVAGLSSYAHRLEPSFALSPLLLMKAKAGATFAGTESTVP